MWQSFFFVPLFSQFGAKDPVLLQITGGWTGWKRRPPSSNHRRDPRPQGLHRPGPLLLFHPDRWGRPRQLSRGRSVPGWRRVGTLWVKQHQQHRSRPLETCQCVKGFTATQLKYGVDEKSLARRRSEKCCWASCLDNKKLWSWPIFDARIVETNGHLNRDCCSTLRLPSLLILLHGPFDVSAYQLVSAHLF